MAQRIVHQQLLGLKGHPRTRGDSLEYSTVMTG